MNGWKIYLNCREDNDEEERYDNISLWLNAVKVVFEAFTQSVIAKFYFVHCPIKRYGWGFLDATFKRDSWRQ